MKEHAFSLLMLVAQVKDVLIDYYVAANDTVGNLKKTDIYHVYVGGGTTTCTTNWWLQWLHAMIVL